MGNGGADKSLRVKMAEVVVEFRTNEGRLERRYVDEAMRNTHYGEWQIIKPPYLESVKHLYPRLREWLKEIGYED